jgi:hypothetical protein
VILVRAGARDRDDDRPDVAVVVDRGVGGEGDGHAEQVGSAAAPRTARCQVDVTCGLPHRWGTTSRMNEGEEPKVPETPAVPEAPPLPEVEQEPMDEIIAGAPSPEAIIEAAEPVEDVLAAQPSVDELLGRDRDEQ